MYTYTFGSSYCPTFKRDQVGAKVMIAAIAVSTRLHLFAVSQHLMHMLLYLMYVHMRKGEYSHL